jgi:hypothetical protein
MRLTLLLCQGLLVLADSVAAAPHADVQADPVTAAADAPMKSQMDIVVANLFGNEQGMGWTIELCGELFPHFAIANKRALVSWRAQHKQSLDLIERNAKAVVLRNAHRDKVLAAKVQALYRARAEIALRVRYLKDPAQVEQICKGAPLALQLDDIDTKFATDLAALRAHPIDGSLNPGN